MTNKNYFVYIIKSVKEKWYYVGHTGDLEARLKLHNKGRVKSTKARRPYSLVYSEEYDIKSEAYVREMEIKKDYKLKKLLINKEL